MTKEDLQRAEYLAKKFFPEFGDHGIKLVIELLRMRK